MALVDECVAVKQECVSSNSKMDIFFLIFGAVRLIRKFFIFIKSVPSSVCLKFSIQKRVYEPKGLLLGFSVLCVFFERYLKIFIFQSLGFVIFSVQKKSCSSKSLFGYFSALGTKIRHICRPVLFANFRWPP